MLSTKIKGESGLSTNYVIRSTKNPKGEQTESKGGQKPPLAPPEINPDCSNLVHFMEPTNMLHCSFSPFPPSPPPLSSLHAPHTYVQSYWEPSPPLHICY